MPDDDADDSSHTRGAAHFQRRADAGGRSPGATLPLALLTQRAGTATADAGCIHDAQASIGFSASFLNTKRLASWTAQRPIRLERKV